GRSRTSFPSRTQVRDVREFPDPRPAPAEPAPAGRTRTIGRRHLRSKTHDGRITQLHSGPAQGCRLRDCKGRGILQPGAVLPSGADGDRDWKTGCPLVCWGRTLRDSHRSNARASGLAPVSLWKMFATVA